jgi:hypothetical protein
MKAIMRIWYEYVLTQVYNELMEYCGIHNLELNRLKVMGSPQTVKKIDKYNKYAALAYKSGSTYIFNVFPREI